MNVSFDRDISMAFEKMTITPTIIHDDVSNSNSHFEENIFQAIDHIKRLVTNVQILIRFLTSRASHQLLT